MKNAPVGIYHNTIQFFRFYTDGTVLDCLIKGDGDRKKIEEWFNKESQIAGIGRGRFTFKNSEITFSIVDRFGDGRKIDYKGKVSGTNGIIFDSLNHNNGRRTTGERFAKL